MSEENKNISTTTQEYFEAAHYHKSRFASISQCQLQFIRTIILVVNFMMLAACLATNDLPWFIYFYTFWGYFWTWGSIFCTIKAVKHPEYQWWACNMTQIAIGLDLIITPGFWILLAPLIFTP